GEQFDAGLDQYYLRARYYNQGIGRMTQFDTYQGNNFDPHSLHKYVYTHNDPVNNIDPSGNISIASVTAGFNTAVSLSTSAIRTYQFVDKANSFLNFYLGFQEVRRLVSSGVINNHMKDALQGSLDSFDGLNTEDAIDSLLRHSSTLMTLSLKEWGGYFTKNAKNIDRFVIYLPQAGVPINREIPIRKGKKNNIGLSLALDSKGKDRLTGIGVGLKGERRAEQVWRMDYHKQHRSRNRGKDAEYFHDRQFHYHIKKAPK
ncbi:MAG: RHS repeat-associated core domain-containing protein, partial [Arenicella sp.]